jgi:hypothetical protein
MIYGLTCLSDSDPKRGGSGELKDCCGSIVLFRETASSYPVPAEVVRGKVAGAME